MDFNFGEEQQILRRTAREFTKRHLPKTVIRGLDNDPVGFQPEMWKQMAHLGWAGWIIPNEYGGVGGSFLDFVALFEEMGRALVSGPLASTAAIAAPAIMQYGNSEQKASFLPRIASGEFIFTLALLEATDSFDEGGVALKAAKKGGDWILNGTKLFVPYAHVAQWILCPARTDEGVTLFLVEAKSQGIKNVLLDNIDSDKLFEVSFMDVKVPGNNVLGQIGGGWEIVERIKAWGALVQCSLLSGIAQQILEMSVQYAKDRVQFDRQIGSFQAVGHKCANIAMDVEGIKILTYQAGLALTQGQTAEFEIAIAKAFVSEAAERVCHEGLWVHGGIGISLDHDMQLYHRKAKVMTMAFGDEYLHREVVARNVLS